MMRTLCFCSLKCGLGNAKEGGREGVLGKVIGQTLRSVATGDGNVLKGPVSSVRLEHRNAIAHTPNTDLQPCAHADERVRRCPKD